MSTNAAGEARRPAGRVRLAAYAFAQLLLAVPVLLLFALWWVAGVLVVVWVGVPLVVGVGVALRAVATAHRRMAADTLGQPVQRPYRPLDGGLLARMQGVLGDPMTWRDLAWALAAVTVGFTLALLTTILLLGVVTTVLWWYAVRPLLQLRSRVDLFFLAYSRTERLEQRVQALTESRAELVDHSAAELRRLERDLHDGAQARLVALSMSLGRAEEAFDEDPEKARRLVGDARETTAAAIGDLRSVVRGIHPPVLADRGLGGAVEALALDMSLPGGPVEVETNLPGRPPAPVESAVYFGVAECLANVGKHAGASRAWVHLAHRDGILRAVVGDDGRGGASPEDGTGMLGVMRRLAAFDGTLSVSSPPGGPTLVTLEVPCDLSSPKTTRSSAPG
ncbi:sensor histidine kinase [Nocardioides cheoyonin]|uniref:sensor histidine kinase n=1 Tax=Nocardioides cheoyonin TaxID=3156615 RepID=UPI0032B4EABD